MQIIFNKNDNGQDELKSLLGFLDADLKFSNLVTDIELNTPDMIHFIGPDMYNKALGFYNYEGDDQTEVADDIVKHIQLYIIIKSYLDYAPNADLTHSNSGRKFSSDSNEKIPWDWQIAADNRALEKRAYKALDKLIILLNQANYDEWLTAPLYKQTSSLFIKGVSEFNKTFDINNSYQLFLRLAPHMEGVQNKDLLSLFGKEKYDQLLADYRSSSLSVEDSILYNHLVNVLVYKSLSIAIDIMPVVMFPDSLHYSENTTMKAKAREEVSQKLLKKGLDALQSLEIEFNKQTEVFEETDHLTHLNQDQKYVSL